MRPMGEVSVALLQSVAALYTPDRGGTMEELAKHSGVAQSAARRALDNLKRAEKVRIVRERKVPARNKPVAEYGPVTAQAVDGDALQRVCSLWVQR